ALRAEAEIRRSAATHLMPHERQAVKETTETNDVRVHLLGGRLQRVVQMTRGETQPCGAKCAQQRPRGSRSCSRSAMSKHGGGREPAGWVGDHKMQSYGDGDRFDDLASAATDGGGSMRQKESDITSQLSR